MWFGSSNRGMTQHIRKRKVVFAANGETVEEQSRLVVQFRPAGYPDWALPIMRQRWPVPKGLVENPINPKIAYGGLNTKVAQKEYGWTDADRQFVERRLQELSGSGTIIELEEPKVEAPWPDYKLTAGGPKRGFPGKTTPQAVVEMVKMTGCDPEQVLLYEEQAFGDSRPQVVAALKEYAAEIEQQLVSA